MIKTFQHNLPLFVKTKMTAAGRDWKPGKHFPWLEMGMDITKIQRLFVQGYLHHNTDLEKQMKTVGDGLDTFGAEELAELVDNINAKVKQFTRSEAEFKKKKCASSKILDKQRGFIRRWRNLYGELENK